MVLVEKEIHTQASNHLLDLDHSSILAIELKVRHTPILQHLLLLQINNMIMVVLHQHLRPMKIMVQLPIYLILELPRIMVMLSTSLVMKIHSDYIASTVLETSNISQPSIGIVRSSESSMISKILQTSDSVHMEN